MQIQFTRRCATGVPRMFLETAILTIQLGCPRSRFWDLGYHEFTNLRTRSFNSERSTAELRPANRILNSSDDSCSWNRVCRADGAGLWQLSERVPYALACGRERCEAALALPQLRPHAHVVGKCAAGELDCAARAVQELRGLDWVAICGG